MKTLSLMITMMLICLITSCRKESTRQVAVGATTNPFSNGGNERNMIVVISDVHMGANLHYSECTKNRGALEKLLGQIKEAPNVKELVIAGDLVDEWFVPANIDTYNGKGQSGFVQQVAKENKGVFDIIKKIIEDKKIMVTYVPGNHDLGITAANINLILPKINQARDDQQGLGTYSPTGFAKLAIEHGHRYNFACAPDPLSNQDIAPGAILPNGYFFTRIAALSVSPGDSNKAKDKLAVVTPNVSGGLSQLLAFKYWQGWVGLMNAFPTQYLYSDACIVTNVGGYTKRYSVNDLMPYQLTPGGFIDMKLYKNVQNTWEDRQTINNVAVHISADQAIADQDDNNKTDLQAKFQYFDNVKSDTRIVVFGHTHHAEIISWKNHNGDKSIYANAGTWIDKNPGDDMTTMNFVVITPQNANASSQTYVKLYNCMHDVFTTMAVDSLRY